MAPRRSHRAQRGPSTRNLLAVGEATGGVAHDVNNALTAIAAHAALVKAETAEPETAEHADAILDAARGAGEVVERVQRLLRPVDRSAFTRVDPGDVAREVERLLEPSAREAGLALRADVADAPHVAGIAGDLLQALVNLARNALEAAEGDPSATRVRVRVAAEQGGAVLEVTDDGPGVPPALAGRIDEPFVRGAGSAGLGLGLSLAHHLAEAHDGHLELARRTPRGTRARLWLPAASAEVRPSRTPTSLELATVREPGRVLLVDDDAQAREALGALLSASGFEVRGVSSATEAYAAVDRFDPTVLVTDLALGDGHGAELIRRVRARDALLPVVVTTGDPAARDGESAPDAEVVLLKPVNPGTLVDRLRELTERRHRLQQEEDGHGR